MYPYHNRILQRIGAGELTGVEPSPDERFAFVLTFSTPPQTRPIRPHAVYRYLHIPAVRAFLQAQPKFDE